MLRYVRIDDDVPHQGLLNNYKYNIIQDSRINHKHADILVIPQPLLKEESKMVPGTDGEKMSKSRNNFIDVFQSEKELKKVINKSIITDDVPLELPKDPDNSTVYKLYKLIASTDQSKQMANKLRAGGYGWGHAKKELSDLIIEKYKSPRDKFNYFMSNLNELDEILKEGSIKAKEVAQKTLKRIKEKIGY